MYDIIISSGISGVKKSLLMRQAIQKYEWLCHVPFITTRERREGIDETGAIRACIYKRRVPDGRGIFPPIKANYRGNPVQRFLSFFGKIDLSPEHSKRGIKTAA